MITSAFVYNAVNIVLGVACLISLILLTKFVPDKRTRLWVAIALVLILLVSITYPMCLRIFKLYEVAYAGELLGRAPEGSFEKVNRFKDLALLGNLLELAALGLLAGASRRLCSVTSAKNA